MLWIQSAESSDEKPAVILAGCSNDNTSCASHSKAGDGTKLHRIPSSAARGCAALACMLETSGSAELPFSVAQILSWLRVRQSVEQFSGWPLDELTTAAQVR